MRVRRRAGNPLAWRDRCECRRMRLAVSIRAAGRGRQARRPRM